MPITVPPKMALNQGLTWAREIQCGMAQVSTDSSATVIADLMAKTQPRVRCASTRKGRFRAKNRLPTEIPVR